MSPSSLISNGRDPHVYPELTASVGWKEICPPGYVFSQMKIISTASTSALPQSMGGLAAVVQEDRVFAMPQLKETGKNSTLYAATLWKINWKPKMRQPILTD